MDEFETYRPLLFSIAYQMLGSAMEAEDIVQETYLRYQKAQDVESPKAYLTTITTRLCLNQINSARARREEYLGPWLPEPVLDSSSPLIPGVEADKHETISMAFLVLLEELTPPERAVFLLREVFDYSYAEIAQILEREEADCRQLYSRAKKHLADHRPRFSSSPEQHRQMLERFLQAVQGGQVDALTSMLAQDAVLWADGAGRPGAATRPIFGSDAIARFVQGTQRYLPEHYASAIEQVNGEAALVIRVEGKPFLVLMIELGAEGITTIRAIGNPDKLKHI
ncbi:MAG: RNA polymerase sigma-70 factor [Chloroflexi bacterium]|nr:RNA polymerase sigma-70 factor [Chloroflexota bacterium]